VSSETEIVRETLEIAEDGRTTIKETIRKAVDIVDKKAFCQIENYGKDKIVITILSRWQPTRRGPGKETTKILTAPIREGRVQGAYTESNRGPGKDVVKK